ncbi:MAG: hypothetical protein Q9202_001948 [Teloschistes flavicans]
MEYPEYYEGYRGPPRPPPPPGYDLPYTSGPPAQYALPPSLSRPSHRPSSLHGYRRHHERHHGEAHIGRGIGVQGAHALAKHTHTEESSSSESSDTEPDNDIEAEIALPIHLKNSEPETQEFSLTLDDDRSREPVAPKTTGPFSVICYDVFHSAFTSETHQPGDAKAQLTANTRDTLGPLAEGSLFQWMYVV